eukprot:1151607-Pelagomonas_calceolata.AAC.3
MAAGAHVISSRNVLSHISNLEDTLEKRNLQKQINLSCFYTRGLGNFNVTISNRYLSNLPWNQDKNYKLQQAHPHRTTGQIPRSLIESILCSATYKDAVILANAHADGRGHAVTLKRSHCTNHSTERYSEWHLLDSLNNHPEKKEKKRKPSRTPSNRQ